MRDLARFLYVQRLRGFDAPTEPHFDPETLRFFEEALAKATLYLEFGSGGSTILADKLGIPTISVEGDRFYAETVRSALRPNTRVQIVTPKMGITGEWSMPLFRAGQKGARYVQAPFALLGDRFPDLVLVDGRYRVACALEIARRMHGLGTASTVVFDDYFDRPLYRQVELLLGMPERLGRSAIFCVGAQPVTYDNVDSFLTSTL